ncbi:MAG: biotin/lipoyl-containing protein, partial [Paracoccaceae bacterium]
LIVVTGDYAAGPFDEPEPAIAAARTFLSGLRARLGVAAVDAAAAIGYLGAGTIEFLLAADGSFYFLEMNTRLQVEHPVTELITGIDLVEQMIRVAYGEKLSMQQCDVGINGWAIESRLYAEDPYRNFLPSIGRLSRYRPLAEMSDETRAIRNDTGVYEGGEISMYYDPMIAKLCTWAPDRASAIAEMRHALDAFEVEGIGHNLPFLSAVMDHERFITGNISTAFIEEEYPEGFGGAELSEGVLKQLAAGASAMHRVSEIRAARVSGRMDNHEREVGSDFVISLGGFDMAAKVSADSDGSTVEFADGTSHRVSSDWKPGEGLARLTVSGEEVTVKIGQISSGFRMRHRGADLDVIIRTPRLFELSKHMIEKTPPDTSRLLLCPMPGLIVAMVVEVGDEVQEGQALCIVEAMKMENVLRAEKKTVVTKINASVGDNLAVDEVIMEFE